LVWQYLTWPFGSGELKNDEKRAITPRRVIRFTSVNLNTHLEVIALFSSNFKNVNTFHPLFQKLKEIDVECKLKTCSACQDLHALQF
jgi:hypothetical protein